MTRDIKCGTLQTKRERATSAFAEKEKSVVGDLEQFEQTLYMAAELSGTTVHTITRPIYLNMCQVNGIRGWTKEPVSYTHLTLPTIAQV